MLDQNQPVRTSPGSERSVHEDDESREQSVGVQSNCPECDSRLKSDSKRGETVCRDCGLVVEEGSIDRGPEWRAFDASENDEKSRVGAPTTNLMHDKGLSTNIGWRNEDAYGNSLSSRQRQKIRRLRTWDERYRTRNSDERNLKHALGEIDRMGSALGLPDNIRETASVIYRRALKENLLPGRSIEGTATSATYAAARLACLPRTIDDVTAVSRIDRMEFTRTYRYLVRELELAVQPPDPEDYISQYASDLDVSDELEEHAHDLLQCGKSEGLHSGRNPVGLAAAALYAASRLLEEGYTQGEVAATTDISKVTIRNRYQELLDANGGSLAHASPPSSLPHGK